MKTTISLLAIIAATILTGCIKTSSPRAYSGPTTDIVFTITCSNPDTRFTGTIVTDGLSVETGGTGHGTFHATGHEFVCSFQKIDSMGKISLSVTEGGKTSGDTTTSEKHGGVRAELLRTPEAQFTLFTTF